MRGLIIGYGRAGQRHFNTLAQDYNLICDRVDPRFANALNIDFYESLTDALDQCIYTFAIIATPPDLHLSQIRECLDAGLPVLCEKPLCSLGQLDEARRLLEHPNADKVMVAYNYRYHPGLLAAVEAGYKPYLLHCQQRRDLPAWGLLLDHVSHDLDIARMFYPEMEVSEAHHATNSNVDSWSVYGTMVIQETVDNYSETRIARLSCNNQVSVDIDPDLAMYRDMMVAFFSGKVYPSLTEAIKTQELLEMCARLASEQNS